MKQKFFNIAKNLSHLSKHKKCALGAVIVHKNRIVSVGINQHKTHTRSPAKFRTLHAEIAAILNARQDIRGCDIYVYRENKNGQLAISKPCAVCRDMIEEVGIKNVYYSDHDGYKKL